MCSANVRVFVSLKDIGYREWRKDKPDSVWSNPDKSGQPFQKKNHKERLLNDGQSTGQKYLENGPILIADYPIFYRKRGSKHPVILFLPRKNWVRTVQILPEPDKLQQKIWNGKTPKNRSFSGFLSLFEPVWIADYLLLNCGARRAALRPY